MKINPRLHKIFSCVFFNLNKILSFVLGIMVGYWINGLTAEHILILGLFSPVFLVERLAVIGIVFVLPIVLFSFFYYLLTIRFKGNKAIWFFLGAGVVSICCAWHSLVQIAFLYYINFRPNEPVHLLGYVFPSVYTFKLFKASFFASLFAILGYMSQILKKQKHN